MKRNSKGLVNFLFLFDLSMWPEFFFRFYAIIINQEYIVILTYSCNVYNRDIKII